MQKPALLGGPKAVTQSIPVWPQRDADDRDAVLSVVDSGHWWMYDDMGPGNKSHVERFEKEFGSHHRAKHAFAVSSGSMALEICVRALGIGPGDEVITTPYTFIASTSCILAANALPVYVDIDPETYNIDPRKIEAAITDRTRAILPVHFSGEFADMEAIQAIAKKHNLRVIEDAAHAHGASLTGDRYAGAFSDAAIMSFQESKNLACGEGGVILTNNQEVADLAWSMRHYGRDPKLAWYAHVRLGSNGRLNELSAALLRSQFRKFPAQTALRQANVKRLYDRMAGFEGLAGVKLHPKGVTRAHHLVMLRYDPRGFAGMTRDQFLKAAQAEGIPCGAGYCHALFENPMFANMDLASSKSPYMIGRSKPVDYGSFHATCPNAVRVCKEEAVWMGSPAFLGSAELVDQFVEGFQKVKANAKELAKATK
ncbi:MAG: DegT/DnrJ/EryC1/StrS family aminotransferase [Planctomycetota bacterium]|nr:DegT/DnrJ/EryC1/StrS family aminotransferase [Planctomycetota bacterium]